MRVRTLKGFVFNEINYWSAILAKTSMGKAFQKAGVKQVIKTTHRNTNIKGDSQNSYLSWLSREKKLVQIEAAEGIGWRGFIKSFDNFSLIIVHDGSSSEELIFKHAVKSIRPV